MNAGLRARIALLGLVLLSGRIALLRQPASVPARQPLSAFPLQVAGWHGRDAFPFDADTERVLAADQYLNRAYVAPTSATTSVINLYIAYYGSQQQGDSIHSPQNCLPGSGWVPVEKSRILLDAGGQEVPINRYLIEKNGVRQLVLYWFQGRGRIVANEFANKAYLMADALRLGRTDGALVRIITPIDARRPDADPLAREFARTLLSYLPRWLS